MMSDAEYNRLLDRVWNRYVQAGHPEKAARLDAWFPFRSNPLWW